MAENFVRAISTDEIAAGGMKAVELDGQEIVICNCGGRFYAIQRRCGHMNAPLELGTLDGKYARAACTALSSMSPPATHSLDRSPWTWA